jgi:hypothetical protein
MKKTYFFPVLLITVGTILLLNEFNLLKITRPYIFILGAFAIGIFSLRKGFLSPDRKGLLAGSFFTLVGVILVGLDLRIIPFYDNLIFGLILMALGAANFLYYMFTRKTFNNITFGTIFCFLGIPFILQYYGSYSMWDIKDIFYTYWPVLLITAGVGFLMDGLVKKTK